MFVPMIRCIFCVSPSMFVSEILFMEFLVIGIVVSIQTTRSNLSFVWAI